MSSTHEQSSHADLWTLALDSIQIDPHDLAIALESQVQDPQLDFRTRLLIRDSLDALRAHWGGPQTQQWLSQSPVGDKIEHLASTVNDPPGFALLSRRLMPAT